MLCTLCKLLWTLWSSRQELLRFGYLVGWDTGKVGIPVRLGYQLIHGEMLLYIV